MLTDIIQPSIKCNFNLNIIDKNTKHYYQMIPYQVVGYVYDIVNSKITITIELDAYGKVLEEIIDIKEHVYKLSILIDDIIAGTNISSRLLFDRLKLDSGLVEYNYAKTETAKVDLIFSVNKPMIVSSKDKPIKSIL